jgi:hypothetical protein
MLVHQPLTPPASTELNYLSSSRHFRFPGQMPLDTMLDNHFIIMHGMTASAAFFSIAAILDLNCSRPQDVGFNIGSLTHPPPPPVAPTLKQQVVPHRPYVDMLPWSSVRDRMLNSITAINEAEFLADMGSGELKVWGNVSWDPMAWEVGPEFARKWWFLMDEGIMHTANFWRGQRGEEALMLAQP